MKSKQLIICKICNEKRIHEAHGMCQKCYNKWYRQKNAEKCKHANIIWRNNNREKCVTAMTKWNRDHGVLPMSENKLCSSFLGIHVAEQVLSKVFKNVKIMPPNNPGYDFICNKGMKIDVKSACTKHRKHHSPSWPFTIKQNITADYFLCIAFNNRKDLNPLHLWLIPMNIIYNKYHISIAETTLQKWEEYELDITKTLQCCNEMKSPSIQERSQKV